MDNNKIKRMLEMLYDHDREIKSKDDFEQEHSEGREQSVTDKLFESFGDELKAMLAKYFPNLMVEEAVEKCINNRHNQMTDQMQSYDYRKKQDFENIDFLTDGFSEKSEETKRKIEEEISSLLSNLKFDNINDNFLDAFRTYAFKICSDIEDYVYTREHTMPKSFIRELDDAKDRICSRYERILEQKKENAQECLREMGLMKDEIYRNGSNPGQKTPKLGLTPNPEQNPNPKQNPNPEQTPPQNPGLTPNPKPTPNPKQKQNPEQTPPPIARSSNSEPRRMISEIIARKKAEIRNMITSRFNYEKYIEAAKKCGISSPTQLFLKDINSIGFQSQKANETAIRRSREYF
jgi:hypothetical protein